MFRLIRLCCLIFNHINSFAACIVNILYTVHRIVLDGLVTAKLRRSNGVFEKVLSSLFLSLSCLHFKHLLSCSWLSFSTGQRTAPSLWLWWNINKLHKFTATCTVHTTPLTSLHLANPPKIQQRHNMLILCSHVFRLNWVQFAAILNMDTLMVLL